MPTVLRKQGLYFARTVQTQRGVLSLSSAMIRPIVAILTGAQPRLSQKPDKAGLHPIRLLENSLLSLENSLLSRSGGRVVSVQ